jgi:hypothetical protein
MSAYDTIYNQFYSAAGKGEFVRECERGRIIESNFNFDDLIITHRKPKHNGNLIARSLEGLIMWKIFCMKCCCGW